MASWTLGRLAGHAYRLSWPMEALPTREGITYHGSFDMEIDGSSDELVDQVMTEVEITPIIEIPIQENDRKKRKEALEGKLQIDVNMAVSDHGSGNMYQNQGQMNVVHGTHNTIQNIQQNIHMDSLDFISGKLAWSLDAEFDVVTKAQRGACTPNTREAILANLEMWCADQTALMLYWLSGMAGTGKTTIVFTLCEHLRATGTLGASFFCSRSVDSCRDVYRIFPTIAYQLATKHAGFAESLANVLRKDPNITSRRLDVQLEQLIIEPIKTNSEFPTTFVVAVDALDECEGEHSRFLETIIKYSSQLPFKLLLTSRPEYVIQKVMSSPTAAIRATKFILHEVEKDLVRADIVTYLTQGLSSLSLPPTGAAIALLVDHSGSLFIYAATLARFVLDEDGDCEERLQTLLDSLPSSILNNVMAPLHALYTDILSGVFEAKNRLPSETENIWITLRVVLCLREPLTMRDMAELWDLEEGAIERRLKRLHAVIFVPEDPKQAVTTFHASFVDFILDKNRSGQFFLDAAKFHVTLTLKCLLLMNDKLCENICELVEWTPNSKIDPVCVEKHVPPALSYVCRYWAAHLDASHTPTTQPQLLDAIQTFFFNHALHWLECLAIHRHLHTCIPSLEILMGSMSQDTALFTTVREIYRVVQLCYDAINHCGSEAYRSALTWVPLQSPLRARHAMLWKRIPEAIHGLPTIWTGPNQTIRIHSDMVSSIAISADGCQIASGSRDLTVRIWNINSHEQFTFRGHTGWVTTVAISPGGDWVASGSYDKTVRIWDIATETTKFTLEMHPSYVLSLAISRYGKWICSADFGGTTLIWQSKDGQLVRSLCESDSRHHTIVTFAKDENTIVINSMGHNTEIRDVRSGERTVVRDIDVDHIPVAISPSTAIILTRSITHPLRVWRFEAEERRFYNLDGHTARVTSAAFFHDEMRAASGSWDRTVRIWDIITGDTLTVLTGHSSSVHSVAIFPDDRRVASGSMDGSIAVWDVPNMARLSDHSSSEGFENDQQNGMPSQGVIGHHEEGSIVAVSANRLCLLSGNTARILDTKTLKEEAAVDVQSPGCIALSSQGTLLAIAGDEIELWDLEKNQKILTLAGHQNVISSIIFSKDDSKIISTSDDHTARVWSASTGEQEHVIYHDISVYVHSAAISDSNSQVLCFTSAGVYAWDTATGRNRWIMEQRGPYAFRSQIEFSKNGNRIIASSGSSTSKDKLVVCAADTGRLLEELYDYLYISIVSDGEVYAYHDDGWIYKIADPLQHPKEFLWVPQQYCPRKSNARFKAFRSSEWDFIEWVYGDEGRGNDIVLRIPHI